MMDCLHSTAPRDEELLRLALDDEMLPKEAMDHLKRCSVCQQRLAQYQQTNKLLLFKLYRSQCPNATKLNFYCANLLPLDEVFGISKHLSGCPLCYAEVLEIRSLLANFVPFPEMEASPHVAIRRILAILVPYKPQVITRHESVRSSQQNWPRLYRAEDINISLHLTQGNNREIMLLGLFSSVNANIEALEGIPVELYAHPQRKVDKGMTSAVLTDHIDDLGNVAFKAVDPGEYTMIVRLPDCEIVVEGLPVFI